MLMIVGGGTYNPSDSVIVLYHSAAPINGVLGALFPRALRVDGVGRSDYEKLPIVEGNNVPLNGNSHLPTHKTGPKTRENAVSPTNLKMVEKSVQKCKYHQSHRAGAVQCICPYAALRDSRDSHLSPPQQPQLRSLADAVTIIYSRHDSLSLKSYMRG